LFRADLANLVNEAALLAGRQRKVVVEKNDFIQAVERSIAVSLFIDVYVCLLEREREREREREIPFLLCLLFNHVYMFSFP
jgi:SpoVK/Ycf46/Vps4 family AAA+-type ATPase